MNIQLNFVRSISYPMNNPIYQSKYAARKPFPINSSYFYSFWSELIHPFRSYSKSDLIEPDMRRRFLISSLPKHHGIQLHIVYLSPVVGVH